MGYVAAISRAADHVHAPVAHGRCSPTMEMKLLRRKLALLGLRKDLGPRSTVQMRSAVRPRVNRFQATTTRTAPIVATTIVLTLMPVT